MAVFNPGLIPGTRTLQSGATNGSEVSTPLSSKHSFRAPPPCHQVHKVVPYTRVGVKSGCSDALKVGKIDLRSKANKCYGIGTGDIVDLSTLEPVELKLQHK